VDNTEQGTDELKEYIHIHIIAYNEDTELLVQIFRRRGAFGHTLHSWTDK